MEAGDLLEPQFLEYRSANDVIGWVDRGGYVVVLDHAGRKYRKLSYDVCE